MAKDVTMCFGPSKAEKELAAQQRVAAEEKKQEEIQAKAATKKEDITEAVTKSQIAGAGKGKGGSASTSTKSKYGRESLFMSRGGGQGFLGRYD